MTGQTRAYDPRALAAALERFRRQPLDPADKGMTAFANATVADLVDKAVTVPGDELTLPLMVIREPALTGNIATMAAWCRDHEVELAPHGKTTMSPQLTARQLQAGAWGITAATIQQVRAFVELGVRRIIVANQLVDPAGIRWLAQALNADPTLTVIGYVDTIDGVTLLDQGLRAADLARPVPVLVELGLSGHRTGARDTDTALAVARAAAATETLDVIGASCFEGVLGHGREPDDLDRVARFCADVRALGLRMATDGLLAGELTGHGTAPVLSAGGSSHFDVVTAALRGPEPATVVIRSGGSVTHDDGLYSVSTPLPSGGSPYALEPALDVWAHVVSRPESERAYVAAGKRDLPYDVALPVVRRAQAPDGTARNVDGVAVTKLNDQHGFLTVPSDSELAVGDLVCFGIAHPCTAFDKWRLVPIVDTDNRVVDVAHTQF